MRSAAEKEPGQFGTSSAGYAGKRRSGAKRVARGRFKKLNETLALKLRDHHKDLAKSACPSLEPSL
jgi:hypothetical protein